MKQIKNTSNQSGFLDSEKVYFVEKFGYLLKKIDNGFGVPVQEALFQRIFMAVEKFKTDLPDVVHELEKTRLKSIDRNKITTNVKKTGLIKKVIPKQHRVQADRITEKVEVAKTESKMIEKNVIEIEIDLGNDVVKDMPILPDIPISKTEKTSSILRPSAATIREEYRQKQIQRLSQQHPLHKVVVKKEKQFTPLVTRPKTRPKKELTVWERAWHRYGGYSEEAMNGHT